jgi:hypothetical protein
MKLIVLVAAITLIWFVVRTVRKGEAARTRRHFAAQSAPKQRVSAADTVSCPACRAYVPANRPTACARADCPYPRG